MGYEFLDSGSCTSLPGQEEGILGGLLLGHTCVCAVEIEPYRRRILLQRQRDGILPWFPIWDDIRTFDGRPWRGLVDVLAGGVPCKGFSTAGTMRGFEHPESGLWREMARVGGEVRPRYIFLENAPAIVVLWLPAILSDLSRLGYDARWGVLGGSEAGLDADGQRFWLLAKAAGQRWAGILQGEQGLNNEAQGKPRAADHADPPTLVERIRKHESRCGEPAILGELDGLPNRVDRLAAIGDGQVPAVVALAWRALMTEYD